jgi:hypothetical protein
MRLTELNYKTGITLLEEFVNSSWIEELVYDEEMNGIWMRTLNGGEYFIPDVPKEEYEEWVSAPSKGKHWWSDVKGIWT